MLLIGSATPMGSMDVVSLTHGSIIRNEIPEMNVLPCPRRVAELTGEVTRSGGGVRCHCRDWLSIRLQPLPGYAVLPLLTTLRSVNRGR